MKLSHFKLAVSKNLVHFTKSTRDIIRKTIEVVKSIGGCQEPKILSPNRLEVVVFRGNF